MFKPRVQQNIHNVLLRDEAFLLEKELLSEEDNTALNGLNMQRRDLDGVYHDLGSAKRHAWKQRRTEESTECDGEHHAFSWRGGVSFEEALLLPGIRSCRERFGGEGFYFERTRASSGLLA